MTPDLRELVIAERRRRGLSIRAAAALGDISNTTWSDWEAGKRDLGIMQRAVSKAFGWPMDWPSNPEPDETPPSAGFVQLGPDTQRVLEQVTEAIRGMAALGESIDSMQARLDRIERQVARIVRQPRRPNHSNG